ncbi:response regulator [Haliangium sp.]|uniref:response regulator n=1 Tax=Haliangium sp. TaxID=2663208 RepID=UPI003D0A8ACD
MNIAVLTRDPVLVAFLERPLVPLGHRLIAIPHLGPAPGAPAPGARDPGDAVAAVVLPRRVPSAAVPAPAAATAATAAPASATATPIERVDTGALGDAVRAARARWGAQVQIVVLGPDPADLDLVRAVGADAFLPVPFSDAEVLAAVGARGRGRPRVLLVDDSALIHRHTAPLLEDAGYEVVSAHDGAGALALCERALPDLVITDVEMPSMDGYALCKALKQRAPHLPVLICSTLGEAADLERGFDAGADDYLVKPVAPEELLTRLGALSPMPGRRERILVVDDSPAQRHYVADCLTRQGFEVIMADNGRAGLDEVRSAPPALVISDYEMPEMTGFELVHALKRDPDTRNIPVIMLTARDSRRDMAQMRAAGATAYLVKPFAQDKCIATVERTLAERRLLAYKEASRFYISEGARRAAEERAAAGDLGGVRAEEREAAVLFSDLQGFTAMSSGMSPRQVIELLNAYFDRMCAVIVAEGGDIDKFIGDAVMAVFVQEDGIGPGEAGAAEHPAIRAVRAAVAMQEALVDFNAGLARPLVMRVGVNTGPVMRGDLGSLLVRRDYTVIGDTVNRAQRYEGVCPPGRVLISASTRALIADQVQVEPLAVHLKGVSGPVTAYVVQAVAAGPGSVAATASARVDVEAEEGADA